MGLHSDRGCPGRRGRRRCCSRLSRADEPFDVMLLDLNMPEVDGYGLAAHGSCRSTSGVHPDGHAHEFGSARRSRTKPASRDRRLPDQAGKGRPRASSDGARSERSARRGEITLRRAAPLIAADTRPTDTQDTPRPIPPLPTIEHGVARRAGCRGQRRQPSGAHRAARAASAIARISQKTDSMPLRR